MSNDKEREALMALVDDYAEASFDQGLHQRTEDDAPEAARARLEKALRDALAARASLAASAGSEPPPMPETWHVVAHVHGEPILSIGYDWVFGKGELDQAEINAVIGMAQHLLAFIGYGLPPSRFDQDADEAASAGSEPVALDHIACIEGGELRYMTGRKAPAYDCELYAMPDGKNAPPLYTHPSPPEGAPDPQLLKFYGVTTAAALIEAQARHIERLQSKSQQTPSFAPRRAREG